MIYYLNIFTKIKKKINIVKKFKIHRKKILIEIKPALIKKSLNYFFIYPGKREEIIEELLRKLVSHGQGYIIDGIISVKVSLHQLYKELKKIGHEYNYSKIKECIKICRKCIIKYIYKKKK